MAKADSDDLAPLVADHAAHRRVRGAGGGAIAYHYIHHPPPVVFTVLASPLVMWIWVGGLIVLGAA